MDRRFPVRFLPRRSQPAVEGQSDQAAASVQLNPDLHAWTSVDLVRESRPFTSLQPHHSLSHPHGHSLTPCRPLASASQHSSPAVSRSYSIHYCTFQALDNPLQPVKLSASDTRCAPPTNSPLASPMRLLCSSEIIRCLRGSKRSAWSNGPAAPTW